MHAHNRLDGADEILSLHCTPPVEGKRAEHAFPGVIFGHLQHDADDPGCASTTPAPRTHLCWTEDDRRRLPRGRAVVTGSAWMYLLALPTTSLAVPLWRSRDEVIEEMRQQMEEESAGRPRLVPSLDHQPPPAPPVVYFPVHGVDGRLAASRLAAALHEPEQTTVVLTEVDHDQPEIVDAYARRGADVTHLGPRVRPLGVTGANRLERLRDLVVGAGRVESNEPHWALLPAAAAGTPIRVPDASAHGRTRGPVTDTLLDLLGDDTAVSEYAAHAMGAENLLAPHELATLLAWRTP
ncbi:hypothetical protein Q9R29_06450 [Rothia sp. ARF10]|nr:hypothetical protein [Rothia sp. ARF10]